MSWPRCRAVELASKFFAPAPEKFVRELVAQGVLTGRASRTCEAGAGRPGRDRRSRLRRAHRQSASDYAAADDHGPAGSVANTICVLRIALRVGLGGGIATPTSAAAAFAMGAAYILTGSVNQACVESGSSDIVRQMLAEAGQADVAMAPAADMFEMGVKVQVLKRGTMFPMRAAKLYELYRAYRRSMRSRKPSATAGEERVSFAARRSLAADTRVLPQARSSSGAEGGSRRQAQDGTRVSVVPGTIVALGECGSPDRKLDYQVWCGPAMGAFNEWAKGSFLEQAKNRSVVAVGAQPLYGAAIVLRRGQLRSQGLNLDGLFHAMQCNRCTGRIAPTADRLGNSLSGVDLRPDPRHSNQLDYRREIDSHHVG